MKVTQYLLNNPNYPTKATLTAYLQTPTPGSPLQEFPALIIVPGGSMTHIPVAESEKNRDCLCCTRLPSLYPPLYVFE